MSPLPHILTGAMAVQIAEDLTFAALGLGVAISLNRAGQAVSSLFFGRLADRLGAVRSIRLSMSIALITSAGIAFTATNFVILTVWLVAASSSHALSQPATNRLLIRRVPTDKLGGAFGVKQAATPTATMLAGLAVPAVAVSLDWRWGFAIAAALAGAVIAVTGPGQPRPESAESPHTKRPRAKKEPLADRRSVLLLAVAFGLAHCANVAVSTFYVTSVVAAGSTPQVAGIVLAAASVLAIGTRLVAGHACDHWIRRPLVLCASLLAAGSAGLWLLTSLQPLPMHFGVLLALGAGWGFNGVFWFAAVSIFPETPGRITGLLSPAGAVGATVGAAVFGGIAQQLSYAFAWSAASLSATLAAALMLLAARLAEG